MDIENSGYRLGMAGTICLGKSGDLFSGLRPRGI
jgi:hypothetical protein